MDWDKLRIFHVVAAAGNVTRASEHLNVSQSAVSRQIQALEYALGSTLFHRHARGLILTEQGELLFDATSSMSTRLEFATARIRDSEEKAFGSLRVTTTTGFGTLWLAPRIADFYKMHPDLNIELMLEERVLDLTMREADVAIRMKEPSQADLIRRKLMSVHMRFYATRKYLDARGAPNSLEELRTHPIICQGAKSAQVSDGRALIRNLFAGEVLSHLKVNNYYGVLQAVLHDLGIGLLPNYLTEHFPALVRVLGTIESGAVPVYLAYPVELRQSRKIKAFRDFVVSEVAAYRRKRNGRAE
ncbi:MAG: LysR family transcriptional regulator [Albidovulum sp.]|nr:LysR family transcriptional regulator [Albidovulum sp.]MDE0531248.1 LysR family transcriptional regulator [Albidovulum sp.]